MVDLLAFLGSAKLLFCCAKNWLLFMVLLIESTVDCLLCNNCAITDNCADLIKLNLDARWVLYKVCSNNMAFSWSGLASCSVGHRPAMDVNLEEAEQYRPLRVTVSQCHCHHPCVRNDCCSSTRRERAAFALSATGINTSFRLIFCTLH